MTSKDGKFTPLNGDFFTQIIARTYRDMSANGAGEPLLPKRATFDLSLTQTDINGWPRHLPVSPDFHPEPLYERTHGHALSFRRGSAGGMIDDDFGLTYASRSTASFPVAFAPVAYQTIAENFKVTHPNGTVPDEKTFTRSHLREHCLQAFRCVMPG
jgi:hypothetical protein